MTVIAQTPVHVEEIIHVVDDDEAVRDSVRWLLEANGFRVALHESAEHLLATLPTAPAGCIVADVRMPGMTGLELQDVLLERGIDLPMVVITGHGDVPMAVNTMKKGAVDFVEKPFTEQQLRDVVGTALERDRERRAPKDSGADQRLARLTARERQVLERIVAGRLNKQIADDLGISIKTVEAHRANVMEKLEARSMAELMKIALGVAAR